MKNLDLCAIVACALSAQSAGAQFSYFATTPDRWGTSNDIIGTRNFIVESFQNTGLAPGLQVSWFSTAGNTGPFSTLPNVFDPATDPYGNAFVPGGWRSTNVLINTPDNLSHPYTQSQYFGDVEFTFTPPVVAVGFSMQQADLGVELVINGISRGTLGSLVSLPFNGGRQGFIVIESAGAERITSLRLNNTGGDGWAIDYLSFTREERVPVNATGFTQWGLSDAQLGLVGLTVEDFEDTALAPGVGIGVYSALGNLVPSSTIPGTFDPASDTWGDAFDHGAWDGTHMLLNTRDNQSHPYGQVDNWGDLFFIFDQPVGLVGFSVEDEDQPAAVLVNGRNLGELRALGGFGSSGRNGYLRLNSIDSLIQLVFIRNGRVGFDDGIAFDHLVFGPACRGDFDGDRAVNTQDLTLLLSKFGQGVVPASVGDMNGDGFVDTSDLVLLLSRFGHVCG